MATVTADVFAVGRWNGMEFSLQDLNTIASNFKSLFDIHKPPVKIGHNNEQPLTDGQPALGWVEDLWVEGGKLMARLTDVPDIVARAIKKKLYRKVSIELDFGVDHPRGKYDMVLSAIALLGADIPAVSTLSDLDAFMSRCQFSASRHASFSAIAGNNPEDQPMSEKALADLTARFDTLQAQVSEKDGALEKLKAENAKLVEQVATFTKAEEDRKVTEQKQQVAAAREKVTALFEKAVEDERITPAQREQYRALFKVDDDDAVTAIDIPALEKLLGHSQQEFQRGTTRTGSTGIAPDDESKYLPSEIVAMRTQELMDEHKLDYRTAFTRVLQKDVELAEAYKYESGRKEG